MQSRWRKHGGLTPPLLFARVRPPAQLPLLRCTNAHTRSGGRQPAVCREAHVQRRDALVRETAAGALASAGAIAFAQARGAYAPRSCSGPHAFVHRESRFFTVERTTRTRSDGRQPAVANGQRTCKGASAIARKTADGALTSVGAIAVAQARGAYAPRSCSREFAHRRNCDFYDVQTLTHQERQA